MNFGNTIMLALALGFALSRGDESPPVQSVNSSTLREYINNGSDPIDEDIETHLTAIAT